MPSSPPSRPPMVDPWEWARAPSRAARREVLRLSRRAEDRDDLFQEAAIVALDARRRLDRTRGDGRAYEAISARNLRRRSLRLRGAPRLAFLVSLEAPLGDPDGPTVGETLRGETRDPTDLLEVARLLAELDADPAARDIFDIVLRDGCGVAEAGGRVGLTPAQAHAAVRRVRHVLVARLAELEDG